MLSYNKVFSILENVFLWFILTLFIKYFWDRRRHYFLSIQCHGPLSFPFIGNALRFVKNDLLSVIKSLQGYSLTHVTFWVAGNLAFYVSDPESVEIVMNSPYVTDKADRYDFMNDFIGVGLITLGGQEWKFHRKLINPSFNTMNTHNLVPVFNEKLDDLNRKLLKYLDKTIDFTEFSHLCTLESILHSLTGERYNLQDGYHLDFCHAVINARHFTFKRMLEPWYQFDLIYRNSKLGKANIRDIKIINDLCYDVTRKKWYEYNEAKVIDHSRPYLINHLIHIAHETPEFNFDTVVNEMKTVIIAGFETTAGAISAVLLMVAMHPKVQNKILEELESIYVDQESEVTINDLNRLTYCDLVVKETLRLFPQVPIIARDVKEDIQIINHKVPKGCEIIVGIFFMHRYKHIWGDDAEEFRPERFTPENFGRKSKFCYVPFARGARTCLAPKYAQLFMKACLAKVIRSYELSTDIRLEDLKYRADISLTVLNGFPIKFKKRISYCK